MITLEQFTEKLTEQINGNKNNIDLQAEVHVTKKNNGSEKMGILFRRLNGTLNPIIYTEVYHKEYEKGTEMEAIENQVLNVVREQSLGEFDVALIKEYQNVKNLLRVKLIHRVMNEELLKDLIYEETWDDLACICYIELDEPKNGTISVSKMLFEKWNVSKEELFKVAMENTIRAYPAKMRGIEDVLGMNAMVQNSNMYVLTNERGVFGAVTVLYPGLLHHISEELQSDLILLPSSIQEFLVLGRNVFATSADDYNEMVRRVNETCLAEDEILSDHAYLYSREQDEVCSLKDA